MENKKMIIFGDQKIRRVWHENDWHYSVVDVVGALVESLDIKQYVKKMKQRDLELSNKWGTICTLLEIVAVDGRKRLTNCADKKGIFRIIQSIPSKKAEPFKLWLAQVGSERIDEIDDPELSIDRAMKTYLAKGYSEKWINQRLKTIEVRKDLTDEWRRSGVEEGQEFAILTNDITLAWSGKSIKDYKEFKGLKRESLRDNMTNLELVLNMLAEATTTEISKKESPEDFEESREVAVRGGGVAGVARRKVEEELGGKVVSSKTSEDIIDLGEKEFRKNNKGKKVILK